MVFLHGKLHVSVYEAREFPGKRLKSLERATCGGFQCASWALGKAKPADAYVVLHLGKTYGRSVLRTSVVLSRYPVWNEVFVVPVAHEVSALIFQLKDRNILGATTLGECQLNPTHLLPGRPIGGWFDVATQDVRLLRRKTAQLRVRLQFISAAADPTPFTRGLGDLHGVPHTYFPPRAGNVLRLYNDACSHDPAAPSCWDDVYADLNAAKHFIYIAGWSVWAHLKLVRRGGDGEASEELGTLLKRKAAAGVRVLVLLWDDQTSSSLLQNAGIMSTRDELTRRYFRRSKVVCVSRARVAKSWFIDNFSCLQALTLRYMFTHHQKVILVDVQGWDSAVGGGILAPEVGLDTVVPLQAGRYAAVVV